jgi:NAD(P)-dependent dehydrogenase (short-subunit alcohol dehydrogenase family)
MKAQTELITKRLDGKIAVITGGSSGIGLAAAQRFVDEGAYVFITSRCEVNAQHAWGQTQPRGFGMEDFLFWSYHWI